MDVVTLGEVMAVFSTKKMGTMAYINEFHKSFGGAEGNVVIGLSRLGKRTGIYTKVGDDSFGKGILSLLKGEGVETSQVQKDPNYPTGIYFKEKRNVETMNIYYYRRDSAASKMNIKDLDINYIKKAKWLHITGITPLLSDSCRELVLEIIKIAKNNNTKICFDPNIRFKLIENIEKTRNLFKYITSYSDIIVPGILEGEFITQKKSSSSIADELLNLGASNVVIKLGDQGAYYKNKNEEKFIDAIKINNVVDEVGAGDGFAVGLLAGLIDELSLGKAVSLGNEIGAMVVMCEGDIEGLPTLKEVENFQKFKENILR